MSRMKETDYFIESANWALGLDWYEGQFESGPRVAGEVSPNYTKHDIFPGVPERIAEYDPQTKLIFLARDPVDRFISHYRHSLLMGHANVQPSELIGSRNGDHMLESSRYAAQCQTFLKVFPREQLLILDFSELRNNPQSAIDQVTRFLEIGPLTIGEIATQNDAQSIASMPTFVQRIWRSRLMRRVDHLISRETRDKARVLLSRGKPKKLPDIPDSLRNAAAEHLAEDAVAFRKLSGLAFSDWTV